jgi:hypothetical protein
LGIWSYYKSAGAPLLSRNMIKKTNESPFANIAAQIKRSRAMRERAAEFNQTVEIIERATRPDAAALARAIILAGKKARGELTEPPPDPNSIAGQILAAGRKRRGEQVDEPNDTPSGELAKQIIAAGRKRRGEV